MIRLCRRSHRVVFERRHDLPPLPMLKRLIGSSTETNLSETQLRGRRISRSLYRQILRWCQTLQHEGLTDDILSDFVPPMFLAAPAEIDAYRTELLFESSRTPMPMDQSGTDTDIVQKCLHYFPPRTEFSRSSVTVPIRSAKDIQGFARAIFRMNNVAPPTTDGFVPIETVEKYQKERRSTAFSAIKSLNELYSVWLAELKESRASHFNRDGVQFHVGQVVQHRDERWRGVVISWHRQDIQKVSSDDTATKTSLTTKRYAIEDDGIRYNVLLDAGDAFSSGIIAGFFTARVSELLPVTDKYLGRVRNHSINDHFEGYEHNLHHFVPNVRKQFEFPADWDGLAKSPGTDSVMNRLSSEVTQGVREFASHLRDLLIEETKKSPSIQNSKLYITFRNMLVDVVNGDIVPSHQRLRTYDTSPISNAAIHVRSLLELSQGILDTMYQRRLSLETSSNLQFQVGDIVLHKKYNFRGIVVASHPTPTVNVTRWDGLQDIENPMKLPFYQVVPDQNDCIKAFGSMRSMRYVCEANLESCPSNRVLIDVDLDPGWIKQRDGSFDPPDLVRFKYGGDLGDDGRLDKVMAKLEKALNLWQLQARGPVIYDKTIKKISFDNMKTLLQYSRDSEEASDFQDAMKDMFKAHPDEALRWQLEKGVASLMAGKSQAACELFQSIVNDSPDYIEGWNKLATCQFMLGRTAEALESTSQALKLDPRHIQAKNGLGLIFFEQKEYHKAAECFRESLDIDPWSPVATKLSVCVDLVSQDMAPEENYTE